MRRLGCGLVAEVGRNACALAQEGGLRVPVYAWLMPFIGVAALVSFLFSGRPYELIVGVVALVWGVLIYRRRFR